METKHSNDMKTKVVRKRNSVVLRNLLSMNNREVFSVGDLENFFYLNFDFYHIFYEKSINFQLK